MVFDINHPIRPNSDASFSEHSSAIEGTPIGHAVREFGRSFHRIWAVQLQLSVASGCEFW